MFTKGNIMPLKTRSRTSKNKLAKKVHVPVWAILIGIAILVGVGILLVRNSFASSVQGDFIWCESGYCRNVVSDGDPSTNRGNQRGRSCRQVYKSVNYLCF